MGHQVLVKLDCHVCVFVSASTIQTNQYSLYAFFHFFQLQLLHRASNFPRLQAQQQIIFFQEF